MDLEAVDDLVLGVASSVAEQGGDIARAALVAGLPQTVPGTDEHLNGRAPQAGREHVLARGPAPAFARVAVEGGDGGEARGLLGPGLRERYRSGTAEVSMTDLQERKLFAEVLDAVRCLDDGVLT